MPFRTLLSLSLVVSVPLLAHAEQPKADAKANADLQARLVLAIQLPTLTHEARTAGLAEADVTAAVQACRVHKEVGAAETAEVFKITLQDVQKNGPVEDFGAFVNTKLNEGLRGKALANAIHKEHKTRGVGKGKKLGHFKDKLKHKDGKFVWVGPHDGHPSGDGNDKRPPGIPRPDDPGHDKVVDHGIPLPDDPGHAKVVDHGIPRPDQFDDAKGKSPKDRADEDKHGHEGGAKNKPAKKKAAKDEAPGQGEAKGHQAKGH